MASLKNMHHWRINHELRAIPSWCIAGKNKAPSHVVNGRVVPYEGFTEGGYSFEQVCAWYEQFDTPIGFILKAGDPFTCIDLDIKDSGCEGADALPLGPLQVSTKDHIDFVQTTLQIAGSYAELSTGGLGVHIWVRGNIGEGKRTTGIELYSQKRFIICTGKVITDVVYELDNHTGRISPKAVHNALPMADGTALLAKLLPLVDADNPDLVPLEETAPTMDDAEIWQKARAAGNNHKFVELCSGRWEQFGFPSQSEADLALMSMFTFYSRSNAQCLRMFRLTFLGHRDKAVKNDVYLNNTLRRIRSRQAIEDEAEKRRAADMAKMVEQMQANQVKREITLPPAEYVKNLNQAQHSVVTMPPVEYTPPPPAEAGGMEWPSGFVGAIAAHIYHSAPRPVREVAIVAALGLMAGLCGKAYNISRTGLNMYIILVARSAVGKEAMHSGISNILNSDRCADLQKHVCFNDYASGPALIKAANEKLSFVNVAGEFGRKLARMGDERESPNSPMHHLRTVLTNLYQKSGAGNIAGGIKYSDKDKNTDSGKSIALSIIGETTPRTLYDSISQSMMEDGFISRWLLFEYKGERPAQNPNAAKNVPLPENLIGKLMAITANVKSIIESGQINETATEVQQSEQSAIDLQWFDRFCDQQINGAGDNEAIRQIWNRAHLKVLRLSALLAVGDNHIAPIIQPEHSNWALKVVYEEGLAMVKRIAEGDVGIGSGQEIARLEQLIKEYVTGAELPPSYKISTKMHKAGVIPYSYLKRRAERLSCFYSHRNGVVRSLRESLIHLCDDGLLSELPRDKLQLDYHFGGKAYGVDVRRFYD